MEKVTTTVKVTQGYVDQRDLGFEDHRRGTNWIATVQFSPAAPGNLEREFWERGSGSFREVPELEVGDFVEVAHDYTSGGGNRSRHREYYRVIDALELELILIEDEIPTTESISNEEFVAKLAGKEIYKKVDLSSVSDEELINEIKKRNIKF